MDFLQILRKKHLSCQQNHYWQIVW